MGRLYTARLICLFCAIVLSFGHPPYALGVDPSTPLGNLARQTWAMENGLPQNTVQTLLQTSDGFVWLGTEAGLVRFDGVSFQVFDRNSNPALPGSDIRCLLESPDGALWIGTSGGLARWKDGTMSTFTTQDGLPGNGILSLGSGKNGKLWLWTDQGPAEQSGGRFVPVSNSDTFPRSGLPSPGEYSGAGAFEERMPDGVVVTGSRSELEFAQNKKNAGTPARLEVGKQLPGSRIQAVLADREGALWIGTNEGLVRWDNGKVERFPVTDPLATTSVLALMEDREHNLWIGTETDGLQILRDQRFRILDTREGLSSDSVTTVVDDKTGTLWVGTQEDGLDAVHWNGNSIGKVDALSLKNGLASDVILSLAAAPNGDLWVGTPDGLNRIRGRNIATFSSVDGLPDDFIRSLWVDSDGSLWIGTRHGLTHWVNASDGSNVAGAGERMQTFTKADGLGSDLVGAMARDAEGDLWIATLSGLSRLRAGKISNFTTANGLSSNVVTALLPRVDGTLLIGTQDRGWNRWDGHKFSPIEGNDSGSFGQTAIHAILDDGHGHLWFATGGGIARCTLGAAGSATLCSNWLEFGTADGLPSREMAGNSHPSAWRSRDGRLWFATPKGLVEVDPEHLPVNRLAPPVVLERFVVDDVDQPLRGEDGSTKVSAGHVHFEFDYAGLSFIAPQKVRYRYRLVGFDKRWTEAGARRAAYYTNIPPGSYTFQVQAANNDGVWNISGAAFSFELRPHFYQTIWFYVLLLAALAGCVLLLLRQRLRHAEVEFRAVLGERNRIAREIHDTLAQGYVGISAHLELLAELLRVHRFDDATKRLNETRDYVREGLAEARQSIWALRTQDTRETTFPVRLRRLVETAGSDGLEAQFNTFGAYRPLPEKSENHLLRIAQEALRNVKKHAQAKKVSVYLEYGPATVTLEVRDDGRGGVTGADAQTQPGHFGFTGMRERAQAMDGTLEVSGPVGEGTAVRVSIPAPPMAEEASAKRE